MPAPAQPALRAVFFDAGDTLLAPYPTFQHRFTAVAAANGERFDQAAVDAALADALRQAIWPDDWGDPAIQRAFWEELYAGVLGQLGHTGDRARLARAMFEAFSDPAGYKLFPDARPALAELAGRGLLLGVISNFEPWLVDVLELEGVHDRFAAVAVSGVVGAAKPDPAIFLAALAEAGVEAAEAVHVGDSPPADVDGARAVGITAVLIDRFGRSGRCDAPRITSLSQLPALLADGHPQVRQVRRLTAPPAAGGRTAGC